MQVKPSKIAAYVLLGHCDRYLGFIAEEAQGQRTLATFPEDRELSSAERRGLDTELIAEGLLAARYPSRIESSDLSSLLETARCGTPCLGRQISVSTSLYHDGVSFELRGNIDLLVAKSTEKELELLLFECKSSERARSAAMLQISLYTRALRQLLPEAEIKAHIIARDADHGGNSRARRGGREIMVGR